jgi:hypothetical protein
MVGNCAKVTSNKSSHAMSKLAEKKVIAPSPSGTSGKVAMPMLQINGNEAGPYKMFQMPVGTRVTTLSLKLLHAQWKMRSPPIANCRTGQIGKCATRRVVEAKATALAPWMPNHSMAEDVMFQA